MDSNNTSSATLDVYEIVTNRIIELLEAGTVPWQQPWTDAGVPMNLISKRPYRGINLWLLLSKLVHCYKKEIRNKNKYYYKVFEAAAMAALRQN